MKLLATALALALTASACAQQTFTDPANLRGERPTARTGRELPVDSGALGLQQLLRKLNTRASILNIVAHPDDEDGGMLTLYSRGLGARVADLSLTRGEGGQNAVTGDFEDALGLLRTQELLANDRYTGVDQMFGTEVDFGFSKTKQEAFAKWTHDRVLYDAVRAIRLYRPMVITSTWTGNVTDGHGQHQVSGEIAQEAFAAAADPNVFPDMIAEGILPWQALRVYARVPSFAITGKGLYDYATNQYVPARFTNYVTGAVTTTAPSIDVIVHEGTPDPLLSDENGTPRSYIQFARIGLGQQKSQIPAGFREAPSGAFDISYHLYGSAICSDSNPIKHCLPEPAAPHATVGQAPTARPITAQPQGLGSVATDAPRAVSPTQTAATTAPALNSPTETQIPRGFSLGSHGPSSDPGFSPDGMPSPSSPDPTFFTGIDTSILSLQEYHTFPTEMIPRLAGAIADATKRFDPAHPEAVAPALADALKIDDDLIRLTEDSKADPLEKANALHELRIKRVQLNDALALALGITTEASSAFDEVEAGKPLQVHIKVNASAREVPEGFVAVLTPGGDWERSTPCVAPDEPAHTVTPRPFHPPVVRDCQVPPNHTAQITRPYFKRNDIEQPVYELLDPRLRNAPLGPAPLVAVFEFYYQGTRFQVNSTVRHGLQPVSIVPPFSIASVPTATVFPNGQTKARLTAVLRTTSTTTANINVLSPHNWTIQAQESRTPSTQSDHYIDFTIHPTAPFSEPQIFKVTATPPGHEPYTESFRPVGYGDLPRTNYYTPATTRVVPVDLTLPTHKTIAYLPGTGDAVPEALASINLTPTILTVADLTPQRLAVYDTVILGVRTYSAHPDLHGAPTQALLDYARNGGNVVVQYQTPEFTAADAPYPLSLGSNEKVVDESAPVALLLPGTNGQTKASSPGTNGYPEASSPGTNEHPKASSPGTSEQPNASSPGTNGYPEASASGLIATEKEGASAPGYALLREPNLITPADFNNWVEERGHGFLSTWDPHYTALTETHDPGGPETKAQADQRGGLITTPLGRGRWTYVAFALYRQLPEAVPGAYRLFVNLLNPR